MSIYPEHIHHRNFGCRLTELILKGYRAVTFENEKIRVTVLADKGTDVYEFLYKPKDTDFLWRSSLGLRARGSYHPMAPVPVGDFLDYYEGGWQEMFPWGGHASVHRGVNTGLHGEVALAPWDYQIDTDTPEEVAVTFSIRTRRSPFLLKKTMRIRRNEAALHIKETATNESGQELEIVWGHHPAYGWPFLDETCVLDFPPCNLKVAGTIDASSRLAPNQDSAWPKAKLLNGVEVDLSKIPSPTARAQDLAFLHGFKEGWYALRNQARSVGIGLAWDPKIFSYLWFWQLFGGGPDYPWWGNQYVTALEPVTSMAKNFSDAIENGTAFKFAAHASVTTEISVWAFEAKDKVKRVTASGVEL